MIYTPKTPNRQNSVWACIGSPRQLRRFGQMGSKRNRGANPIPDSTYSKNTRRNTNPKQQEYVNIYVWRLAKSLGEAFQKTLCSLVPGGRGHLEPGWAWPPCAGDLVPICRMAIHRLPSVHDMILFIFNRMQRNMERARNMNNEVGGRNQGLALVQSQVILEADTQHTDRSMALANRVD